MNAQVSAPMFVTHPAEHGLTFFGNRPAGATEVVIEGGIGMLEVYICVGCGLVEW